MAQPGTVDEFIDLVRKSGVADEKRLDAYLAKMRASFPPEPAKVAGLLVQDGILTHFQAENILQGKWRRFSIGKYKVLEKLGSGGFAQVYLCEHKLMRRRVAVKVLPVAKTKDSSALERFFREARAAARLDHPNIVHAYDIDQDEDLHFLVTEYVDGSNLLEIVQHSGPLSVLRACHYIRQAAFALQHAHEHDLIHRDVKPGNILVDRTGVVKVLDMGLALVLEGEDEQLTRKHDDGTLGTADYLSPEQAMDSHDVDIRTDIYSLGVTFYYLLTGKAPFEGVPVAQKLLAHQMKQPRPISDFRRDVPAGLVAVIDKMMAKNAENRYATPGDVADALEPYTQTPISPPSDDEMPKLSLAAGGRAPGEAGHDSGTPRASGSGSGKKLPAAASTPPPPSSKPKPAAPAPLPTQPVAVAPLPPPSDEPAPWMTPDDTNVNTSDELDTPMASPAELHRPSSKAVKKRTMLTMVLVAAFVVIPICVTSIIAGVILIFFRDSPAPLKQGPPKFEVSKDPTGKKNARRSIKEALRDAQIDSIIELWDEIHEENVEITPLTGRTQVTLQAAPGKTVKWKSARKDPNEPILKIRKAPEFKLKGERIVLDGTLDKDRMVNDIIWITLESPGVTIEDAEINNFARTGIFIINSGGTDKLPMKLSGLFFLTQEPKKTRGAIYFEANPDVLPKVNDNIEISSTCRFQGFDPGKGIQVKSGKTNGPNVRLP